MGGGHVSRPLPTPITSLAAERELPAAARASFDRRWSFFFIAELNGLADQRRLAAEEQDDERVLSIDCRFRRILASLAWAPRAALSGAHEFARENIDYPEDAWGSAIIIGALDQDVTHLAEWLATLTPEVQRELAGLQDLLVHLGVNHRL